MRGSWLVRLGLVAAAGVIVLAPGAPAWADMVIPINDGNVPTTAAGFGTHECDPNQGGGPFPGEDVWVFVLQGNHDTTGDFVSVTADYGTNGTVTITAVTDPDNFDNGGPQTSKAWIVTPAGWTLEDAEAVITGTAKQFNLTHTCPASGKASPSPTVKPSGAPETGGGGGQATGSVALGIGALAAAGVAGIGLTVARRRRTGA